MKLSERFDRRYQQTPLAVPVPPGAQPASAPAAPAPAPAASDGPPTARAQVIPMPSAQPAASQPSEASTKLTPAMATAKNEIHAQMLAHHTAQIDLNNRPGIRRHRVDSHLRAKAGRRLLHKRSLRQITNDDSFESHRRNRRDCPQPGTLVFLDTIRQSVQCKLGVCSALTAAL